jgi:hypothetical protein
MLSPMVGLSHSQAAAKAGITPEIATYTIQIAVLSLSGAGRSILLTKRGTMCVDS